MSALPAEAVDGFVSTGGLSFDGPIGGVPGALLAARHIASAMVWRGVTSVVKG
ncbi:MAG: hypothetical protein QF505_04840 [Candidatus Micropelagos thuwalensis]|nr:hypothetical protein [Candidatus Micropelagos thuwalensis]